VPPRILILSWEYPPIVEGGLARHVRKLAEELVRQGLTVHVLARGRENDAREEVRAGVRVHRVPETRTPARPRPVRHLDRGHEPAHARRGRELLRRFDVDVVHGHDWLVAAAAATLAEEVRRPYLTTVHATEYGRHQGWVDKHPQSYIHAVETWMAQRADRVIVCSHYMRGHVADVFGVEEAAVTVIPNGIDPGRPRAGRRPRRPARALRAAAREARAAHRRLVYEKGFQSRSTRSRA
jgi:glycogen(starch) synthase